MGKAAVSDNQIATMLSAEYPELFAEAEARVAALLVALRVKVQSSR